MEHAAPKTINMSNTLPIIDISPYFQGDIDSHGRISTSAALHAACLDYGFFYLDITKYVDPSEPEELIRLARQFFELPQDEKDKIALKNEDNARGQWLLSLKWSTRFHMVGRIRETERECYQRQG
jgi:isopenicillin N synthase-like dioxygenase